jgi:hypothetical protein
MSTLTATDHGVQKHSAAVLPTASAGDTWRTVGRIARRTGRLVWVRSAAHWPRQGCR